MCDVVLDAGGGNAQLALRLDEAHHRVDLLIFEGIHSIVLAALMLIGSHYDGMDYNAVGQGYSSRKSDAEIFAISNSGARGAKVLVSKVPTATVCLHFQTSSA
jgi:hypothetical protein